MNTAIPLLRHNELFGALTDYELGALGVLHSELVAIADSGLCKEGREAPLLYVVVEGQIVLQKTMRVPHGRASRRTTVTVCRPGEAVDWKSRQESCP